MTLQPADLDRLERKHTRTTKPTMEPDPADPMRARQTAYCQWCAVHQLEDDPRWPCLTSRLVAAARLGAALAPILGLRITSDEIEAALSYLGPIGDRGEAFVKVAAQAAAASLALAEALRERP